MPIYRGMVYFRLELGVGIRDPKGHCEILNSEASARRVGGKQRVP